LIQTLNDKSLAFFVWAMSSINNGFRKQEGQTATEYVAVTVVGVILALAILYVLLKEAITNVVENITDRLQNFIDTAS
jgi:hypothetical protein